jgi:hypothetical protein
MSDKAYLIKRIEELEAKKKALEASDEPVVDAIFSDDSPEVAEPEESPQASNNNGNPMPKSLRGMSSLDITLHFLDGQPNREEWDWKNKKRGPQIDFSHYGPNGWLAW